MNGEPKLMKMPSYLKKVKRWHDKRIQKREFKVGEYVLLYNSRFRFFAGKLLSKWEGPYVIEEVYRSRAIKINNAEGTNPKVVNGQRIKHNISGNPINVETNVIETIRTHKRDLPKHSKIMKKRRYVIRSVNGLCKNIFCPFWKIKKIGK